MTERHRSEDPFNWGMTCALQDDCENCHFGSSGGMDKREAMEAPDYVPEDQREAYLQGYRAYCDEHYGESWQTATRGWQKGPTDESKTVSTHEEAMSLDDAIDHAMAKAGEYEKSGDEDGELEYRQFVRWLVELDDARYRAKQLSSDLDKTRKRLHDLQSDITTSMDEDVHVTVAISRMNKGWRHANQISRLLFETSIENRSEILREVIEKVAYEAALGFFRETR